MAVAVNGTPLSKQGNGVAGLTQQYTAGGTNRAVFLGGGNSGAAPATATATYNAVSMTEAWDYSAETFYANAGYYLVNPPTTANVNAVINFSGSQDEATMMIMGLEDVNQTTPVGTVAGTASGSGTTATTAAISGATDGLNVAYLYSAWTTANASGGSTKYAQETVASGPTCGAGFTKPGAASTTVAATRATGSGTSWLIRGICFLTATTTVVTMDMWYQPPSTPRWSKPTVVPSGMGDRSRVVGMAA